MRKSAFEVKDLWRFLVVLVAGVASGLGAVAAAATLAGTSPRTNSLLLRLFAAGVLLVVVLWSTWQFFRTRSAEKDQKLDELTAEVDRLQDVVRERKADLAEIAARQSYTYAEELDMTLTIGRTDDEDRVREEARMTPKPLVVCKPVRPIVPTYQDKVVKHCELGFSAGVKDGDDGQVQVKVIPLEERTNHLSLCLLFRPDLTKTTDLWMEYSPVGLWAPFRKSGHDKVAWTNQMRRDPEGKSPLTKLVVRFVFLDSGCNPNVRETGGRGEIVSRARNEDGQWVVEWHDLSPDRLRYEWWLTGGPTPPDESTSS